jgi:phage-related protein
MSAQTLALTISAASSSAPSSAYDQASLKSAAISDIVVTTSEAWAHISDTMSLASSAGSSVAAVASSVMNTTLDDVVDSLVSNLTLSSLSSLASYLAPGLDSLVPGLGTGVSDAISFASTAVSAAENVFSIAQGVADQAFSSTSLAAQSAFSAVTSTAQSTFDVASNAAQTAFSTVSNTAQNTFTAATSAAQAAFTSASSTAQSTFDAASNTAQAVYTAASGAAQTAFATASGVAQGIYDAAKAAADAASGAGLMDSATYSAAISTAQDVLNTAVTAAQGIETGTMSAAGSALSAATSTAQSALTGTVSAAGQVLSGATSAAQNALTGAMSVASQALIAATSTAQSALTGTLSGAQSLFDGALSGAQTTLDGALSTAQSTLTSTLASATSGLDNTIDYLINQAGITLAGPLASTAISSIPSTLSTLIGTAINAVAPGVGLAIQPFISQVLSYLATPLNAIVQDVLNTPNTSTDDQAAGPGIMNASINTILAAVGKETGLTSVFDFINNAVSQVTSIVNSLQSVVGPAFDAIWSAVSPILNGLSNTIMSTILNVLPPLAANILDDLTNAVEGLTDTAAGFVDALLGNSTLANAAPEANYYYLTTDGTVISNPYTNEAAVVGTAMPDVPGTFPGYTLVYQLGQVGTVMANGANYYELYIYSPAPVTPAEQGTVSVSYQDVNGAPLATDTLSGTVGSAYTTTALVIPDYTLTTTPANANGTVASGTTTVIYVYTQNPAAAQGTVTINYVDDQGNVLSTDTITGTVGDNYTSSALTIPGYTLTTTPANASGVIASAQTTVTYVYTKVTPAAVGSVIVSYIDQNGVALQAPESLSGNVNDAYTTTAATISGYVLVATPANATGTYTAVPISVIYVYTVDTDAAYLIAYDSELTVGESVADAIANSFGDGANSDGTLFTLAMTTPVGFDSLNPNTNSVPSTTSYIPQDTYGLATTPGAYNIYYLVKDSKGNMIASNIAVVTVVAAPVTQAPVLSAQNTTLTVGDLYNSASNYVSGTDSENNAIVWGTPALIANTSAIPVDAAGNVTTPGQYDVSYYYMDPVSHLAGASNIATVTVVAAPVTPPTAKPTLSVQDTTVWVGAAFNPASAVSAVVNSDGTAGVPSNVTASFVDTTQAGNITTTYAYTDPLGQTATATGVVHVARVQSDLMNFKDGSSMFIAAPNQKAIVQVIVENDVADAGTTQAITIQLINQATGLAVGAPVTVQATLDSLGNLDIHPTVTFDATGLYTLSLMASVSFAPVASVTAAAITAALTPAAAANNIAETVAPQTLSALTATPELAKAVATTPAGLVSYNAANYTTDATTGNSLASATPTVTTFVRPGTQVNIVNLVNAADWSALTGSAASVNNGITIDGAEFVPAAPVTASTPTAASTTASATSNITLLSAKVGQPVATAIFTAEAGTYTVVAHATDALGNKIVMLFTVIAGLAALGATASVTMRKKIN